MCMRYARLAKQQWLRFVRATDEKAKILKALRGMFGGKLATMAVLDIGAGTGEITLPLSDKALFVKALEPDEEWFRGLQKGCIGSSEMRARRLLAHNSRWENAHISERYDLVLVSHVLACIPEDFRGFALGRAYSWVERGGHLVLVTSARTGRFAEILEKATRLVRSPRWFDSGMLQAELETRGWPAQRRKIRATLSLPAKDAAEIIAYFAGAKGREFRRVAAFAESILPPRKITMESEMHVVQKP